MTITGKVHCLFEQSGTFKNEFIKLGIPAEDYDIQNNFGQTDHIVDLFEHIEAAIMKGEGVTAGVADLTLYLPNSEHHGLCIEMKTAKGRQSEHQKLWQKLVQGAGYRYKVCHSLEEFQDLIREYLKKI